MTLLDKLNEVATVEHGGPTYNEIIAAWLRRWTRAPKLGRALRAAAEAFKKETNETFERRTLKP